MGFSSHLHLLELFYPRLVQRLRVIFPPEVTGLVVAMGENEFIALARAKVSRLPVLRVED